MPMSVAPSTLPAFAFTWVGGEGLYVNLGSDNPGAHQTLVGRRNYAFYATALSWVNIEGFEIAHAESRAIFVQYDCTDLVIARNQVSFSNSYGIEIIDGIRVQIEQNVVSDGNYHAIGLTSGSSDCIVRGNECCRNYDPAIRRANGIYVYSSDENTFADNRLHDNQDSGMMFTGGSDENISCNNRSWNNGDHGFDHVDAAGSLHTNDVAYGNFKDGFSVEGDSPNTQIHNCIAVDNGLTVDEFDLWVNDLSAVGFVSDYNLFWNSTSQEPFKWIDTKYAGLADYQSASGQDLHSLQTDPRFTNAPGGDFYLFPDSPAIDAGTSAVPNWPDRDAVGQGRVDEYQVPDRGAGPVTYADIGALEVTQQVDNPDVVGLPNPIRTAGGRRKRIASVLGTAAGATLSFSNGHPNPTHDAIEFTLDLPQDARVRWEVFDLQGRVVWSEERELAAGRASLSWDGSGGGGGRVPSGVYLVRAAINGTVFNRRVVRF
jgi:parallel beta-helix repeat protein